LYIEYDETVLDYVYSSFPNPPEPLKMANIPNENLLNMEQLQNLFDSDNSTLWEQIFNGKHPSITSFYHKNLIKENDVQSAEVIDLVDDNEKKT